jgi:hypothetical protein
MPITETHSKLPEDEPGEPMRTDTSVTRWAWVALGALIMGGIALGAALAMKAGLLFSGVQNTEAAFWYFELTLGFGFLLGSFAMAALSPGRTVREPLMAALLAFVVQTAVLWLKGWVVMNFTAFVVLLVIDGGLAYLGAWMGEAITSRTKP